MAFAAAPSPSAAQSTETVTGVSAGRMLEIARRFERNNDLDSAERIYQALEADPHLEIRNEARYRHGELLTGRGDLAGAADLYRAILAEQPEAYRVRVELSALLSRIGDDAGARRELGRVDRGALPPEVRAVVKQFADALRSREPFGGSLSLAIAPDGNINRATRADTLDTIIAPLELSDAAKAQSGTGLDVGAQIYGRLRLSATFNVLARLSTQADLYEQSEFNDVRGAAQVGLEWRAGANQFSPSIGRSERWYGGDRYSTTDTLSLDWRRLAGPNAQLHFFAAAGAADYAKNDLQDGWIYDASVGYERSFQSGRWGMGLTLSAERQDAADPGYATTAGGFELLYWRRFQNLTAFASMSGRKLSADERLFLFLERREDSFAGGAIGAAFPQFEFHGFAPLARLSYERNWSTVGIYDYDRVAATFGFTRDF